MHLTLLLLALGAIAFLTFNIVISVRVWRIRSLPGWRRALPGLPLRTAPAATLSRAADTTVVAETLAFPLNAATAAVDLFELRRHRTRTDRTGGSGPSV
ncbi:hypothetical protein J7E93_06105 [Streptomyces sp. ISL-36]|uniref:hypothetical protein n=1 Tax=Streptomyces sp. ISL-36 TaxID=2819182 RepID=UPI001BED0C6D|nr:hypothetical protein [Streptomyces sp. ISL-36]MBT2439700.1 hypothetical protein [Streptomyces sp. ISL-36]